MDIIAGIDIGGTKCAVSFAENQDPRLNEPRIFDRVEIATPRKDPEAALNHFIRIIREKLDA